MTSLIAEASPRFKARTAGFFWLMTIVTGAVALFVAGRRSGVAANLVSTACYVAATLLVYGLLKPVNRGLSLLAAFFSLVGCAVGVLVMSGFFHLPPNSPLLFFGLHCLLVGYLILRSTFLPRLVGALMALGGLGWLTLGLASLLSPPFASYLFPYIMIPGIIGETSLTLWLLAIGVNAQRWQEQAGAAGEWQ